MGLVILLLLTGVLLVLAEIFIIPGVGVAGVLGLVSMTGSCYYAFAKIGTTAGIIVTVINIVLVVALVIYFMRAKTWKKFELNEVIDAKGIQDNVIPVGSVGTTTTRLAPMGTARIANKTVEVTSLEGMIDPNVDVEVVRIENNKIYVRRKASIPHTYVPEP